MLIFIKKVVLIYIYCDFLDLIMYYVKENLFIIIIAFFATIAGLLFGFDTGVISGALQFISKTFSITSSNVGLKEVIVSSVPIGALIGACLSNISSRVIGRRNSIILTALLFIIGTLIACCASSVYEVVIGRLIMGLAVGLSAMIVPMYLSEVSPAKIRGSIVFCFQLAITIGLLGAFVINYFFAESENWRAMFAVGLIPSILLGVGMLFLPYSPRWLVMQKRNEEARKILKKLTSKEDVTFDINEIKGSLNKKHKGFSKVFSKPIFTVAIICFLLFAFQQLIGINTIMYYAPTIYQHAGFAGSKGQILASLADGVAFVLATLVGIWAVDKFGRRRLFFIGFTGMIFCLCLLGFIYQRFFSLHTSQLLALASVVGYIIFFGISLGPLCYLMMSELFPLTYRGVGMAIASCGNWGFNVLVSSTFLTLIHILTISYTFFLYAICTFVGLLFCYFLVPETKGVSLEKIESNLYGGMASRDLGVKLRSHKTDVIGREILV